MASSLLDLPALAVAERVSLQLGVLLEVLGVDALGAACGGFGWRRG
jgi:hypothetical protein